MLTEVAIDYQRVSGRAVDVQVIGLEKLPDLQKEILFDVRNRAGQFDGYIINPVILGELAVNDGLHDLTDVVRSYSRNPNFWLDVLLFYRDYLSTYDGKVLLFPFDGDVFSLFYRSDLLEQHGKDVPKTWEEYIEVAKYFHGMVMPQWDPALNATVDVTLAGSCIGRILGCGGGYWAQLVLATMTQISGPATGSLLDTKDMSPLLDEAMEETLRILEEQAKYGAPDEFDGCTGINFQAMNDGRCVLSYNWGNSFTEHTAEGSMVVGKLGVTNTPGSSRVLDRATGRLVDCTPERCPFATRHTDANKKEIWVNQAPYAAFGGFSGAVSNNVNQDHKDTAADFLAFASDTGQAMRYVIPDQTKEVVSTGQDPYRQTLLDVDKWLSRGYPEKTTRDYLGAVQSQLSSKNVVADALFPEAADILDYLDGQTWQYLNETVRSNRIPAVDRPAARRYTSRRIAEEWTQIIRNYDNDPSSQTPLLEIYQRIRGVYEEPPEISVSGAESGASGTILSTGAIVGIVIGSSAAAALVAIIISSWYMRKERKKRDEDNWYIPPSTVTDTEYILGHGSFGVVTKGFLRGSPVALKHPNSPSPATPDDDPWLENKLVAADGEWHLDATVDMTEKMESWSKRKKILHPLHRELMILVQLRHPNIVETLGATIKQKDLVIVLQYMEHNTVRSILNDPNGVAGTVTFSLEIQWALQVARGMAFLHSYPPPNGPMLHNDLKSSNVLLDASFNAHISDFGLASKTMKGLWGWIQSNKQGSRKAKGSLLWMAPEILNGGMPTSASDVYSYGMFLCELMTRSRPFNVKRYRRTSATGSVGGVSYSVDDTGHGKDLEDELEAVKGSGPDESEYAAGLDGRRNMTLRNQKSRQISSSDSKLPEGEVWLGGCENSSDLGRHGSISGVGISTRSSLGSTAGTSSGQFGVVQGTKYSRDEIVNKVKNMSLDPPFRPDLPDNAPHLLRDICLECWNKNPKRRPTMEEIKDRLNAVVSHESVTKQLLRRGSMFDSIIPGHVQDQLSRGETVAPVPYDEATVIFSDIVSFTSISSALTVEEVGDMILRVFSKYYELCRKYGVKKLDIIGDAFIGVVGVPEKVADHAGMAASFATQACKDVQSILICSGKQDMGYVKVRFGIASGPVVAAVIGGAEHPKYTLFGDTVNTASRMESSGAANQVQCTEATANAIKEQAPHIQLKERGTVNVKGKGDMITYWVGDTSEESDQPKAGK